MGDYAIHDGRSVVNVIVADSQEIAEAVTGLSAIESTGVPWLGWTLVGGVWTAPPEPEPAPSEPALAGEVPLDYTFVDQSPTEEEAAT